MVEILGLRTFRPSREGERIEGSGCRSTGRRFRLIWSQRGLRFRVYPWVPCLRRPYYFPLDLSSLSSKAKMGKVVLSVT